MVRVRYLGSVSTPMRYDVYVSGERYNARGYAFSAGRATATVTQEEADVLTGATPALWTPDGKPINAVVRRPLERLEEGERWEVQHG